MWDQFFYVIGFSNLFLVDNSIVYLNCFVVVVLVVFRSSEGRSWLVARSLWSCDVESIDRLMLSNSLEILSVIFWPCDAYR